MLWFQAQIHLQFDILSGEFSFLQPSQFESESEPDVKYFQILPYSS